VNPENPGLVIGSAWTSDACLRIMMLVCFLHRIIMVLRILLAPPLSFIQSIGGPIVLRAGECSYINCLITLMIDMTMITDEFMREMIERTKDYCIVLLHTGPNRNMAGVEALIWEHARRNFFLRASGKLPIVCPVNDGSELCGLGIFGTGPEETRKIMDEDPAVERGVFTYEIHSCRSFPGDKLPG